MSQEWVRRGFNAAGERGRFGAPAGTAPICSTSPVRSVAACVAAELAEREGRAAAEIIGHVDAALHGDVGARAGAGHAADFSTCPALTANACQ